MTAENIVALCARLAKLPAAVTSDVLGEMGLREPESNALVDAC